MQGYEADFAGLAQRPAQPWLKKLRREAFAQFCERGFPTTHEEAWRFTNLARMAKTPFRLAQHNPGVYPAEWLSRSKLQEVSCRLVFVNGTFVPELSSASRVPGLDVKSLAAQIATDAEPLTTHLGAYLDVQRDSFCALNTAFLADGAYVHIARGVSVREPVHLVFLSVAGDEPSVSHPRNLILAEPESEVTIVEEYLSLDGQATLCNAVTELAAGENATVSHYRLEEEGSSAFCISTLRIEQARSANVNAHSLLLGGGLVRNNVHAALTGEGSECLINGLYVGHGDQHLDNYMLVEHRGPHTSSRQFYNGVLDDHAHGVFHGRIIVHKPAQKTDAKQTNRNLLLSDDAQVDTKPQLEIYADDVKCTHGATIGQIDDQAMFYLRSRGMDEESSRRLLLMAFSGECLERMHEGPARDYAAELIRDVIVAAPGLAANKHKEDGDKEIAGLESAGKDRCA
jgi:Fe-S cluster assembly protein SufD